MGMLDEILNAGGSARATVWDGNPLAETERKEIVYDMANEPIPVGTKVKVDLVEGKWYVTACAVS